MNDIMNDIIKTLNENKMMILMTKSFFLNNKNLNEIPHV